MLDEVPGYPPLECVAQPGAGGGGIQLTALESLNAHIPPPHTPNRRDPCAEMQLSGSSGNCHLDPLVSLILTSLLHPHIPAPPSGME